MITKITQGIKISVETKFEGTFYKNHKVNYAFTYQITIENQGKDSVQLTQRHWEINDALSLPEIVDGEGVIGKKPVLHSGQKHTYSSGCLLTSPYGSMGGYYTMVNFSNTRKFHVQIPTFMLNAGFALN